MNASDDKAITTKIAPCGCTALLGVLVIVFAWWTPGWAPIALTVLGGLLIIKGLVNRCCCADGACARSEEETPPSTT